MIEEKFRLGDWISPMKCLLLISLFLLLASPSLAQDLDQEYRKAIEALKRSETQDAIKILKPLAKRGHAGAQFQMGLMYDGLVPGIRKNPRKETQWFKMAAEQGHPDAQLMLGYNYSLGRGVKKNYVQAYKWHSLAATQGVYDAAQALKELSEFMAPAQVAKAQKLAREWRPKQKR